MFATSQIEISRSAFKNNIDFIKKMIGNEIKFSSVIKGNAYGHGIRNFLSLAEENGCEHFSVFSAEEALIANKVKKQQSQLMIMGMLENEELGWAIRNNIQFYVFELDRLEKALQIASKQNQKAMIHVNLETGMNRIGFEEYELPEVMKMLRSEHLEFMGLCTHLAGAESITNYYRVKKQLIKFRQLIKKFKANALFPKFIHCASSAATMNYPKTRFNLVRIGILQYGLWPSRETLIQFLSKKETHSNPLKRIISWKSKVMNIKNVKTGEFIGYSNSYLAQEDLKIAIVPVGYANGYSRSLSNHGSVLIHGRKQKVLGLVNMNMMLVNITDIPQVKKGDEVVLIGNQGDQEITVSAFGDFTDQMNYESLARLPDQIPRKIVD